MRMDKYRDMALRNPIGCTWWEWLDLRGGWEACAKRLRSSGVLKYYGTDYDCDMKYYRRLTKELLPIMVWDIGMDSWWLHQGVPLEVAQGDIKGARLDVLREDVIKLRKEWRRENGLGEAFRKVKPDAVGSFVGELPIECYMIDLVLEDSRVRRCGSPLR